MTSEQRRVQSSAVLERHGVTDVGCVREHNEDQYLIAQLERHLTILDIGRPGETPPVIGGELQGHLLVVADGMGGHGDGERASAVAAESLARYAMRLWPWGLRGVSSETERLRAGFEQAVRAAQQDVFAASRAGAKLGTTLTALYVNWPDAFVLHVGDSRFYAHRGGRLYRMTRDHTAEDRVRDAGAPVDVAERFSHVLVNAVGAGSADVEVELHHFVLEQGDVLMLCSDGLTGHVDDTAIGQELARTAEGADLAHGCHALVESAKAAGGEDNITVVMARVGAPAA